VNADEREYLIGSAAMALGGDLRAYQALTNGLPVPRDRLDAAMLERIGEPVAGDPLALDEALALRVEAARPVPAPEQEPSDEPPSESEPSGPPWRSQPWAEFRDATDADDHTWLIDGLLPAGMLAFVAGPPKKGKTWLGLGLALAIATGKPLCGEYAVPEPRRALYVALEGSKVGIRARVGALTRGLELSPDRDDDGRDDLERLRVLYRPRPFDLADLKTATWLRDDAAEFNAAFVVVDVLRAAARIRENVAEDFALVRDGLEPMLAAGRTVALLHHFGKLNETQKERSPGERMAGTGAMYGALDVGFLITRSDNGARRLRVDVEARDFAAPDALGVVILGTGTGQHGGFTYADTATLAIDPAATEDRDLADEIETLFGDGVWRTAKEIAGKKSGIGANVDDVREALAGAPDRFAQVDGVRVGRHATAKPWGTFAMLAELDAQKVTRPSESAESAESPQLALAAGEAGDSPVGEESPESPASRTQQSEGRPPSQPSHPPLSDPDEAEVERLAALAAEAAGEAEHDAAASGTKGGSH
jgi:AAA domain